MIYDNDKLNEIFHATWPNLGWAAKREQPKPDNSESDEPEDRPD